MKELLREAIAYIGSKGAEYGEIRFEDSVSETIRVRNGEIEAFSADTSTGAGVRVLYKGAWGFSATRLLTPLGLKKAADEAVSIASAFASVNAGRVRLSPVEPFVDTVVMPFRIDPFMVSPETKIGLLVDLTAAALRFEKIDTAEAFMEFCRCLKLFMSTEGACITQEAITSGAGYQLIASDGDEAQRRSYPDAHHGLYATKGYELIEEIDMPGSLARVAAEASSLLSAPECPSGVYDIIIDGPQMALQLHESCGHPVELDRVLGSETGFAGGSFLTLDRMGSFKYGSRDVNIYADPNEPFGAGSYRYDDEGVKAERVELVSEGVFTGYLSSRETGLITGKASNGSMRAESWRSAPLVRMSNISLAPGSGSLSDLISDTRRGILFSTNRSWSIDDLRLNFQFGAEMAWEIRDGHVGRVLKNPVYFGITPDFWASCDGVTGKDEWRLWGLNSCGKGEPLQTACVGHGASPARFRGVEVGVAREEG